MRVGIVTFDFDRTSGGLGHWCGQFTDALLQRGHEVHVLARRFDDQALRMPIVRHVVPASKSRLQFAAAAEQRLRGLSLDVVHDLGAGWRCDVFQPHGGSHSAWLARRLDMYPPWFRSMKRPFDWLSPRHRDFVRHCQRQFESLKRSEVTFIAISQSVADDFVRWQNIPPERIVIIHNGVDCRRFSPAHRPAYRDVTRQTLGVAETELLLFMAAHNFRLKGLPEVLEVVRRLAANRRPVRLLVAGGKRMTKWRHKAARLGLAERVTFLGSVSDLVQYYAAADVFVQPTYYDPCSLVLLEAAASGLPIVTTRRYNGAAELFHDGHSILTVNDPSDHTALYERIDALFDDRLRTRLGTAAREVALRHPFERNASEIFELYQRRLHHPVAA